VQEGNREALRDAEQYHYCLGVRLDLQLSRKADGARVKGTRRVNVTPEPKDSVPTHASAHVINRPPPFGG
jgi:hypothetical protein